MCSNIHFRLLILCLLAPQLVWAKGWVRVRIAEEVPSAVIRGFDLRVYDLRRWGLNLLANADKSSEWEVQCTGSRVHVVARYSKQNQKPLDFEGPVSFQTPVGFLSYGSYPYRDEIRVYPRGKVCDVVNEVSLEKYLDGLVNSEFSSKWSEESVAAQVVVARTYAYHQIRDAHARGAHYDLDATTKDQVYNGSLREDYHSSRAVEKTRGLVLTLGASSYPIKAFYHSTCGGQTELPQHVWGRPYPGLRRSVRCSYCRESPRFHWVLSLTRAEISAAIQNGAKTGSIPKGWPSNWREVLVEGKLLDLRFSHKDPENRVSNVTTVWAHGRGIVDLKVGAPLFREWIGPTKLRSTSFDAVPNSHNSSWHFSGLGNGHGVGMCQWGAKVMGEKGYKMQEILKAYYPDATLRKLW